MIVANNSPIPPEAISMIKSSPHAIGPTVEVEAVAPMIAPPAIVLPALIIRSVFNGLGPALPFPGHASLAF